MDMLCLVGWINFVGSCWSDIDGMYIVVFYFVVVFGSLVEFSFVDCCIVIDVFWCIRCGRMLGVCLILCLFLYSFFFFCRF